MEASEGFHLRPVRESVRSKIRSRVPFIMNEIPTVRYVENVFADSGRTLLHFVYNLSRHLYIQTEEGLVERYLASKTTLG